MTEENNKYIYCPNCGELVPVRDTGQRLVCSICNCWLR